MRSTGTDSSRDPRDRALVRVAVLLAVLAVALLYTRGCGSRAGEVSSARAVELAQENVSFTPDRKQIRYLQRGVPPRSYWGVSFVQIGPDGRPTRVEVFLVDAKTGDVTRG